MKTLTRGERLRNITSGEEITITGPGATAYEFAGCFDHGETSNHIQPTHWERIGPAKDGSFFTPGDRVIVIDTENHETKGTIVFAPKATEDTKGCISVLLDGRMFVDAVHLTRIRHSLDS